MSGNTLQARCSRWEGTSGLYTSSSMERSRKITCLIFIALIFNGTDVRVLFEVMLLDQIVKEVQTNNIYLSSTWRSIFLHFYEKMACEMYNLVAAVATTIGDEDNKWITQFWDKGNGRWEIDEKGDIHFILFKRWFWSSSFYIIEGLFGENYL